MIDRDRYPIDPWRLVETSYSHDEVGVSETLFAVGNGYLGLRGNSPAQPPRHYGYVTSCRACKCTPWPMQTTCRRCFGSGASQS